MAGDLFYHVKRKKKGKVYQMAPYRPNPSLRHLISINKIIFHFWVNFSFHVYRHQYPHQHHNIPDTVYLDFSEPEWELI